MLAELFPNNPNLRDERDLPVRLPALGAVKETNWSYIRREGQVREELFHLSDDPRELHNLTSDPSAETDLKRLRGTLDRLTGGPLSPDRFPR